MDTAQYLSMFLEESMDNLQTLNESLLLLEQEPENIDKVNEIFRVAHTIKGMAATMGYSRMSELTHKMEDVLSKFREGDLKVSQQVVTVLFKCLDTLEQMVDGITESGSEDVEIEGIIKELEEISINHASLETSRIDDADNVIEDNSNVLENEDNFSKVQLNEYDLSILSQAVDKNFNVIEMNVFLDEKTLLKSARAFLIVQAIEAHGEIVKAVPTTEDLEQENFDLNFSLIVVTHKSEEFMNSLVKAVSEVEKVMTKDLRSTLPVRGQSVIAAKTIETAPKKAVTTTPVSTNVVAKDNDKKPAVHKKVHQSVRVDLERLDKFMNMVSELVINRTRLEQIGSELKINDLNETLEQVARTTSELQDLVMKIRMLPLDTVFNRFPRMVRDLSVELGKEIDLKIEGQDTELDRTVIDEIGEPLIHLIRNAVDHGIERKEDRISAGKSPIGVIKLVAYQEGTKAVIKVVDDGAGLNVDKIRAKAERVGISTEGMNDNDIKNLIFEQGFSTNEQVTDISGRGVGMDVVKTKVSSLGGTLEVISEMGVGSQFIIRLPLTLQIIQALLVKVGEETLAISLGYINEIIEYNSSDIKKTSGKEVIVYRGNVIPLVRVNKVLDIEANNSDKKFVVITKVGDKDVGIIVDSLCGQQEIVIKPLGKTLKELNQYIGATILGDGFVTLILDVAALI
ncbi:chemotaxis protein CheA [Clostridium cellulovorans]|uniref:Chemotaxis protein CheA n=1 Tax=Clostridium cellulovorans (strain ATCC 35296 / DSM 3052 / OCM 3 / 743B) TaxID=573061 RepID=D9SKE1_CLOC7|nr:chemotaxis protein CheA [Clostridium cellulovorans]ADL51437.1 CheA signal transduction histidine kinase [Clostridium cellulovorans 743B]